MINKINHVAILPNKQGFEFIAVLKDGTMKPDVVIIDFRGLHTISDYKNTIGWLPLDFAQQTKFFEKQLK